MSVSCSTPGGPVRRSRRRPALEVLVVGGLLAFGVIAWEHTIHAYLLGRSDTLGANLGHWLRDSFLALLRDIERVCTRCRDARRCWRELEAGTAAEHCHEFCPNAGTFDDLVEYSLGR